MMFLKFDDKAAFEAAFAPFMVADEEQRLIVPAYIGNVAVDVIGTIPVESGNFQEVEIEGGQTIQIPIYEDLPGYHVNLSGRVEEFAAYEVETPETPYRVFAGWNQEPEPERVPAQVPRWAAVLALKSHPCKELPDRTLWDAVVMIRNQIITQPDGESITVGSITVPVSLDLKNRIVAALDDANFWERGSEMVSLMATAIGLSQEDVDALFIWAGKQHM